MCCSPPFGAMTAEDLLLLQSRRRSHGSTTAIEGRDGRTGKGADPNSEDAEQGDAYGYAGEEHVPAGGAPQR